MRAIATQGGLFGFQRGREGIIAFPRRWRTFPNRMGVRKDQRPDRRSVIAYRMLAKRTETGRNNRACLSRVQEDVS